MVHMLFSMHVLTEAQAGREGAAAAAQLATARADTAEQRCAGLAEAAAAAERCATLRASEVTALEQRLADLRALQAGEGEALVDSLQRRLAQVRHCSKTKHCYSSYYTPVAASNVQADSTMHYSALRVKTVAIMQSCMCSLPDVTKSTCTSECTLPTIHTCIVKCSQAKRVSDIIHSLACA
jgi:hypothetical protein